MSNAAVAFLTGILGFFGSWIGAQIALSRFKQERAFDRQLDWYERAVKALHSLAEAIEIAGTFQAAGAPRDVLEDAWRGVQSAHLKIDRVAQQAPLYASHEAVRRFMKINDEVQKKANLSDGFDPAAVKADLREDVLSEIYDLPEKLIEAGRPLLAEARLHLRLDRADLPTRVRKFIGVTSRKRAA